MKDIVYFDLETRYSAAKVGGWGNKTEMRMSVGVTYSMATERFEIYTEDSVDELIEQLRRADCVVGFNHINFDYGVLQRYTMWSVEDTTRNLDLCRDIELRHGFRLKLDTLAQASLGCSKTAEGTQALKWWAEYEATGNVDKVMEIARYCCFDVKVTREVHAFGAEHGFVRYETKTGEIAELAVDWKL